MADKGRGEDCGPLSSRHRERLQRFARLKTLGELLKGCVWRLIEATMLLNWINVELLSRQLWCKKNFSLHCGTPKETDAKISSSSSKIFSFVALSHRSGLTSLACDIRRENRSENPELARDFRWDRWCRKESSQLEPRTWSARWRKWICPHLALLRFRLSSSCPLFRWEAFVLVLPNFRKGNFS